MYGTTTSFRAHKTIINYRSKPLTLLYGQCDCDLGDKFKHFLTHVKVLPPSTFGSHHTYVFHLFENNLN